MKYQAKPVIKEAIQWNLDGDFLHVFMSLPEIFDITESPFSLSNDGLFIETLEGKMHVSHGDYIVKGIKGEFYPCKPDIFELAYEKIDE